MRRTWLVLYQLPLLVLGIQVLSSDQDVISHVPDSGAEVLHSSLAGQDTVTICVRFITYQFTHHGYGRWPAQVLLQIGDDKVLLFTAAMTEQNPVYKCDSWAGKLWRNGDILFADHFNTRATVDLTPGVWNNYCITLSASNRYLRTVFNGKIIADQVDYDGYHLRKNQNLRVLGKYYAHGKYKYSLFGAMTDINIWNRSLAQVEVEQWGRCELGAGGNLLDWDTAQWQAEGLESFSIEKKNICNRTKLKHLQIFRKKRDFNSTLRLCQTIGGEMVVAEDSRTVALIRSALKPVKEECGNYVYSGYTDREVEGEWVNTVTGEKMDWVQWESGQPSYAEGEDCAELNLSSGKSLDFNCDIKNCPVCQGSNL